MPTGPWTVQQDLLVQNVGIARDSVSLTLEIWMDDFHSAGYAGKEDNMLRNSSTGHDSSCPTLITSYSAGVNLFATPHLCLTLTEAF